MSWVERLCCLQEFPSWSAWWIISLCTRGTRGTGSSTIALSPNCCATTGQLWSKVTAWQILCICFSWLHLLFCFFSPSLFRSHPAILEIPKELFYDNELQCHADENSRNSYCRWEHLPRKVMIHAVITKYRAETIGRILIG